MNNQTKQILTRWQALKNGDGLGRATTMARGLWIIGLGLCVFVIFGIIYRLHLVAVAIPAAALGWIVAERNALLARSVQWPILTAYIDWKRVEADLNKK
ncbi:hypothetical protein [Pedosphaera parvula]|uniref:Transmembrane protein n=1 Tax=Pedosphaera parvula (strain Ellin514) TaxID=320771 RepID=B9XGU9_PEDPL|nr:hypothetical protein [Pedosphaera parvula]EEF60870.1 hypothetical protein Cflav_PD4039 [Pedosphaera parvula Ellin514]